ncbi:helix-turn-helix transcriptional regulator [Streptomyces sp. NPDC055085]
MPGWKKSRKDMSAVELSHARARDKHTSYLRQNGKPVRVDAGAAIAHLQGFHGRGMLPKVMAAQSGLSLTTVRDLIRGRRPANRGHLPIGDVARETVEAALNIRFEAPLYAPNVMGPTTDPVGVVRRLQGLMANGWPLVALGEHLEAAGQWVWMLVNDPKPVTGRTVERVAAMYDKLCHVDPADVGVSSYASARAKGVAARGGYAPTRCWDADTIDDPAASPEWTGACGTIDGYLIHHEETIAVCDACALAASCDVFDRDKLREARLAAGLTQLGAQKATGVDRDTIKRFEMGRTRPSSAKVRQLANGLGVGVADLCSPDPIPVDDLIRQYRFNLPELLRLMGERKLTGAELEEAAGLPNGVVTRWVQGHYAPRPATGRKMAAALDVVWTDFYMREP